MYNIYKNIYQEQKENHNGDQVLRKDQLTVEMRVIIS